MELEITRLHAPVACGPNLHAITNPLSNPQRVTFDVTVPSYGRPGSLPQMGSSSRQSTFDSRFWSCVWRNGSLWAAHHHSNPVTSRWYEIETNGWPTSGQNPSLAQSGDNSSGSRVHTAFNSISVDAHGNALTTYARSSTSEFISIERAFRLAGEGPSRQVHVEHLTVAAPHGESHCGFRAVQPAGHGLIVDGRDPIPDAHTRRGGRAVRSQADDDPRRASLVLILVTAHEDGTDPRAKSSFRGGHGDARKPREQVGGRLGDRARGVEGGV